MDWSAWLSKTGLDPALVHAYGLEFTRNELQGEDLAYFDHEFLQSMGISVAKHRLEILKLARKDVGSSLSKLRFSSALITAISKTRRSVGKYVGRYFVSSSSSSEEVAVKDSLLGPSERAAKELNGRVIANISTLTSKYSSTSRDSYKADHIEKVMVYKNNGHRSLAISGPVDGLGKYNYKYKQGAAADHHHHHHPHHNNNYKSPRLSGPLPYGSRKSISLGQPPAVDVKSHEKALLDLRNFNYSKSSSGPLDRSPTPTRRSSSSSLDGRPAAIRNMKSSSSSPSGSGPTNRSSPRVSNGPLEAAPGQRPSPRTRHRVANGNLTDTDQRMVDGLDEHSQWAKLFHDMKPT
ncbi:hypothetical protein SAY86_010102 [Trapa natans]|uniref:SAM domain-containing protein n=1 Tax=Trapa natans TaxID=22666 RepID=A0AAN7KX67_TRANT|nr:hypothetical protein SAY86_010102 [Trapa natans]